MDPLCMSSQDGSFFLYPFFFYCPGIETVHAEPFDDIHEAFFMKRFLLTKEWDHLPAVCRTKVRDGPVCGLYQFPRHEMFQIILGPYGKGSKNLGFITKIINMPMHSLALPFMPFQPFHEIFFADPT